MQFVAEAAEYVGWNVAEAAVAAFTPPGVQATALVVGGVVAGGVISSNQKSSGGGFKQRIVDSQRPHQAPVIPHQATPQGTSKTPPSSYVPDPKRIRVHEPGPNRPGQGPFGNYLPPKEYQSFPYAFDPNRYLRMNAMRGSMRGGYRKPRYRARVTRRSGVMYPRIIRAYTLSTAETKFSQISDTAMQPGNGGIIKLLNGLTQGVTDTTRTGSQVILKYAYLKFICTTNASATTDAARVIVFLDRQPNGGTPALTDLLNTGVPDAFISTYEQHNRMRFKILFDQTQICMPMFSGGVCYTIFNCKLPNLSWIRTQYNGNAGTAADLKTNGLFYLVISKENTNKCTFLCGGAVGFKDF